MGRRHQEWVSIQWKKVLQPEGCEDGMGASGSVSALLLGVGGAPLPGAGVVIARIPAISSPRVQPGQDKWKGCSG